MGRCIDICTRQTAGWTQILTSILICRHIKLSRNKTNRWNVLNTTCLINHSCRQVHRLQMFTEIFSLQKTTDDVLIQQNTPNNSGGSLGWMEADENTKCVVVLQRENVKATKTKRAEPFKEKKQKQKQKQSSELNTSHPRHRAAGPINRLYLMTTKHRIQAEQTADGSCFCVWENIYLMVMIEAKRKLTGESEL